MKVIAVCDNCGARLEIEVETEDIMEAVGEAFNKLSHKLNCPRLTITEK